MADINRVAATIALCLASRTQPSGTNSPCSSLPRVERVLPFAPLRRGTDQGLGEDLPGTRRDTLERDIALIFIFSVYTRRGVGPIFFL